MRWLRAVWLSLRDGLRSKAAPAALRPRSRASRGFTRRCVACGERCVRRAGRRHRPPAAASLRSAWLGGALQNSLLAARSAQTAAVRMKRTRFALPPSHALLRRCLHGRPGAHTAHRERACCFAQRSLFSADPYSSHWGQIPIQDDDLYGVTKRRTKLDSDPNRGFRRKRMPTGCPVDVQA